MAAAQARRMWVEVPPGLTVVAVGLVPGAFAHPTLGRASLHLMHRAL